MISTFDSNVLVYATGPTDAAKASRARDLIARGMRSGSSVLLLQTLGEFAHAAIRKGRLAPDLVGRAIDAWRAVLPVHPVTEEDVPTALTALRDHRLSFWDALLWATARRIGARYLLSEDLQDGLVFGGVRIINPFAAANAAAVDRILPS